MDLVFDNHRIIELLIKRGNAIKYSESGQVFYIEHLIALEKEKRKQNICGVFITFENDSDVKLS